MSSWVDNQRRVAFKIYSKVAAMKLHFASLRAANSYSYIKYNGTSNFSEEKFLKNYFHEIPKYIKLNNLLKDINVDEFLFQFYRKHANLNIKQLVNAIPEYNNWKSKYGTKENFIYTNKNKVLAFCSNTTVNYANPCDLMVDMLFRINNDTELIEACIYVLQKFPDLEEQIKNRECDNAIIMLALTEVNQFREFYNWFCII